MIQPFRTGEAILKQAWWQQVLDPALLTSYPGIKMINWFEWIKPENEAGGSLIDWRSLVRRKSRSNSVPICRWKNWSSRRKKD